MVGAQRSIIILDWRINPPDLPTMQLLMFARSIQIHRPSGWNARILAFTQSTKDSIAGNAEYSQGDIDAALNALEDLREPWAIHPREKCLEDQAVRLPVQCEWA